MMSGSLQVDSAKVVKGAQCALMGTSVSPLLYITVLPLANVYLSGPNQTARFVIYIEYYRLI